MLLGKRLGDLTEADLQALIPNGVREDRHIDYKETLPGRKDSEKKDFLADVAAFANSGGGDIAFGIQEERDPAGKPTGLPKAVVGVVANVDEEVRRLTSVIESGLDPQLVPKVQFRELVTSTGSVLILRVPKSWASPHMVRETWRFYARQGPQNLPMDTGTLRAAFSQSEGWAERVRRFRDQRVARIVADQGPDRVQGPERMILHLVPFSISSPEAAIDPVAIKKVFPAPVIKVDTWGARFNADGVLLTNPGGITYTQFFRNGAVETVAFEGTSTGAKIITPSDIEDEVLLGVNEYRRILADAGVTFPLAIMLTLVGVEGREVRTNAPRVLVDGYAKIDRDVIFLPDVLVEDALSDLHQALRPLFDSLWQSCGHERSQSYAPDGKWVRSSKRS